MTSQQEEMDAQLEKVIGQLVEKTGMSEPAVTYQFMRAYRAHVRLASRALNPFEPKQHSFLVWLAAVAQAMKDIAAAADESVTLR